MKRKTWIDTWIKSAGLATPAAAMLAAGQEPTDNIVLIHGDDLGWRDLGYMGSPVYETPHLDRLAASGTQFTNAYAASSICTVMGGKPTDPDKVDGEDLSELIFHGASLGERNLFWNFPCFNSPAVPDYVAQPAQGGN